MSPKILAWLRFFRVVNLPTVPGDVLAGAAMASCTSPALPDFRAIAAASLAAVLLYMFGLADNDIVGAATDQDRPIPQGLISMRAARIARALCLVVAVAISLAVRFEVLWWAPFVGITLSVLLYNRTKLPVVMGLCRGINCLLGAAACNALESHLPLRIDVPPLTGGVGFLWFFYIWGVTKYSEGEETDPARKRRVGLLIGALVWLQLAATLFHDVLFRDFSFAAAQLAMIALLFLLKRLLPGVSAS